MILIITIPAYNEEATIASVVTRISRNCEDEVKILVINDGSTDNTVAVVGEAGADRIISHGFNKGLGTSFQTGIETALEVVGGV